MYFGVDIHKVTDDVNVYTVEKLKEIKFG